MTRYHPREGTDRLVLCPVAFVWDMVAELTAKP